jgi:hypothetical protein
MSAERIAILDTVRRFAEGQRRDLARQLGEQFAGRLARDIDEAIEPFRHAPAGIGYGGSRRNDNHGEQHNDAGRGHGGR